MTIVLRVMCRVLLLAVVLPTASHAAPAGEGAVTEIRVDSPSVAALRRSLADRFSVLSEFLDGGAIGLTRDGRVALRDAEAVPPDLRPNLERLVADENKDRATLIREIARANGRPDWEDGLRSVFARRWLLRAPAGWYVQESSGNWVRKTSSLNAGGTQQ